MPNLEFFLVDDREVALTNDMHVSCDGGNGPLGHPVEFMTLERGGAAVCKYCGRRNLHHSHPDADDVRKTGQPYCAAGSSAA